MHVSFSLFFFFISSGAVLALTCALMLLNTDLHGQVGNICGFDLALCYQTISVSRFGQSHVLCVSTECGKIDVLFQVCVQPGWDERRRKLPQGSLESNTVTAFCFRKQIQLLVKVIKPFSSPSTSQSLYNSIKSEPLEWAV